MQQRLHPPRWAPCWHGQHGNGWNSTEIPTVEGKLFLTTVIDLYSRRLLGAATAPTKKPARTAIPQVRVCSALTCCYRWFRVRVRSPALLGEKLLKSIVRALAPSPPSPPAPERPPGRAVGGSSAASDEPNRHTLCR